MEKDELLSNLENFRSKLNNDVIKTLYTNYDLGYERWSSWVRLVQQFFELNLPSYLQAFKSKAEARSGVYGNGETMVARFLRTPVTSMDAFFQSLILDCKNDELVNIFPKNNIHQKSTLNSIRKAFIVHGHDDAKKYETARFLEKLGFEAVILDEQANGGETIIGKLENNIDVGFAIVLYTPDDEGKVKAQQIELQPRARQNVIFEHGLLIGALGRNRVFPLVTDNSIELPSDISGIVYMSEKGWKFQIAKEIAALGYEIDLNKLL